MYLIFSESNFYNAIATFYYDLVVFGTASILAYEDFDNVVNFVNPLPWRILRRHRPQIPPDDLLSRIHHDRDGGGS